MFILDQCGYKFVHPEGIEIDRPVGAPHYVFVYYRSPALFLSDENLLPCQGQCVLLEPGARHYYRSSQLPYVNDWIHFDVAQEAGRRFLDELRVPLNRLIPVRDERPIASAIKALHGLEQYPAHWRGQIAAAQLTALFSGLGSYPLPQADDQTAHKHYAIFLQLRAELFQMPRAGTSIASLARRAGLSTSRFHHLYKLLFQTTAGEDIAAGRLERAKYLLRSGYSTLASIAESSGYTSETHLCRQFRQHTGMTPGQFRRAQAD